MSTKRNQEARSVLPPGHVAVCAHDLWIMLLTETRYSMGRMSTAPVTCQDHLRAYAPACDARGIDQIRHEVERELQIHDDEVARTGASKYLGWGCDVQTWREAVEMLRGMAARKKREGEGR